jgi:hypothetical protein
MRCGSAGSRSTPVPTVTSRQADRRTALAVMVRLPERDGYDLVDLATAGPTAAQVMELHAMSEGVGRTLTDPHLTDVEHLLCLLSLGALETLLAPGSPTVEPGRAVTALGTGVPSLVLWTVDCGLWTLVSPQSGREDARNGQWGPQRDPVVRTPAWRGPASQGIWATWPDWATPNV